MDRYSAEQAFLEELDAAEKLSADQQRALLAAAQAGDPDALDRFVRHNTRLVITIATRYRDRGLDFLDLVQEGRLGLLKAIEKFDADRGYQFSTYAAWWIRQSISRALEEQSRTIRLPSFRIAQLERLRRLTAQLTTRDGVEPTRAQLAAELGTTPEEVELLWRLDAQQYPSDLALVEPGEGEAWSPKSRLVDLAPGPEHEALAAIDQQTLDATLAALLPPREYAIVRLRFGFDGRGERTFAEIGAQLGISRQQAGEGLERALKKLRGHFPAAAADAGSAA